MTFTSPNLDVGAACSSEDMSEESVVRFLGVRSTAARSRKASAMELVSLIKAIEGNNADFRWIQDRTEQIEEILLILLRKRTGSGSRTPSALEGGRLTCPVCADISVGDGLGR